MPICPVCGSPIEYLEYDVQVYEHYHFFVNDQNQSEYEFYESQPSGIVEFRCPECWEILFNDIERAEEFLFEDVEKEERERINYKKMVRREAFR